MSNRIKTTSWKERRAAAERPTRVMRIPVNGRLNAEIDDLNQQLVRIQAQYENDERFVGNPEAVALAEQIKALQAQADDEAEEFVLRAIPRRRRAGEPKPDKPQTWQDLWEAWPPRPGNKDDEAAGVNRDDFSEALVKLVVVSPVLDDDDWDDLLANVFNEAQYDELAGAAWMLHRGRVTVPLSRAAWTATQTSASS